MLPKEEQYINNRELSKNLNKIANNLQNKHNIIFKTKTKHTKKGTVIRMCFSFLEDNFFSIEDEEIGEGDESACPNGIIDSSPTVESALYKGDESVYPNGARSNEPARLDDNKVMNSKINKVNKDYFKEKYKKEKNSENSKNQKNEDFTCRDIV